MNGMNFILEINDNSNEDDEVNDEVFSLIVKLEPRVSLPSTLIQNTNTHINNNSNETNYITRYDNNIINNNTISNLKIELICKYIGRKRMRKKFKFKKKI